MSFITAPLCNECWTLLDRGDPIRVIPAREETCTICEFPTHSGIYVRMDPTVFGVEFVED